MDHVHSSNDLWRGWKVLLEPIWSHQGMLAKFVAYVSQHVYLSVFSIMVEGCSYATVFYKKDVFLLLQILHYPVYICHWKESFYFMGCTLFKCTCIILQNFKKWNNSFLCQSNNLLHVLLIQYKSAAIIFLNPRSGHILSIHSFQLAKWFWIATLRITLQR